MSTPVVNSAPAALRERLPGLTLADEHRLRRRLGGIPKDDDQRQTALDRIAADIDAAETRVERRRASVPSITYPQELPVSQRRDDLLAAIRDNQVVIVAGETGSGKTTQIPKICLELGRGVRGLIGHTQPRRLAARTVAERIAEELGTPLGETVGYKVRFADHVGNNSLIKVMTDGILLAEISSDRMLRRYDTLIIDEAHERSLNIDFILGYLKQLLPRRPDLKVVITSATIDPDRFARHFGGAPIVTVSGRMYPVEIRYRPVVDDDPDRDQIQAVVEAVAELDAEGKGDVLVFASGEREIRDTADALRRAVPDGTEIVPLYARLAAAEQHKVFEPHRARRVVIATNVAETSLTVPGIRYVIDPGTARISRYNHRTKVQRLPIEAISQASANQRSGRCGRLAEGICIRLYAEDDFLGRPPFTDPEILRTTLAAVILKMAALGLGDIASFPFVDPPDRRSIRDGMDLLHELGALEPPDGGSKGRDAGRRLTPLGRRLANLPVDPRLGRMVLEAERNGCVHEVMVIAAALSIQDPRERPTEHEQAATQKHARFAEKESDFLSYLNLWSYLRDQQEALSSSAFRRMCKAEYLHYLRIREWQDLYAQLREAVGDVDTTPGEEAADPRAVHVSLLAGLLSHIGMRDAEKRDYLGARGARFAAFPGSALFRKPPRWVMAAELVETSRLWGRTLARIDPEWVEPLAGHLVMRVYSEPHWEADRGAVMASEKVTLYGVPIVASRKVNYGSIDPEACRDLFIRHALVEGDWRTHHAFWRANEAMIARVEELEHRARRRDFLVDDDALFAFYDDRVGPEVVSTRHFDTWWKKTRQTQPDLLTLTRAVLLARDASGISEDAYPDRWRQGDLDLALTYRFDPGASGDGVTVHIPLEVLNRVDAGDFAWLVPGLRLELVTALIRSLRKDVRRAFVPAPDVARAALEELAPRGDEPFLVALEWALRRVTGVGVPPDAWRPDHVPDHLRMTFRITGENGRTLAEGKDLDVLADRLRVRVRAAISQAAVSIEREGLTDWTFGTLPRTFSQGGGRVQGFPALVDTGDAVAIRVLAGEAEQRAAMITGTRRLLMLTVPSPLGVIRRYLTNSAKLALSHSPYPDVGALLDDCVACAVDVLVADNLGPAWDADGFARLRERVRTDLVATTTEVVDDVEKVLTAARDLATRLTGVSRVPVFAPAVADVRAQVAALIHPGFVSTTGARRLPDVARYLRAADRRLEKLPADPGRDARQTADIAHLQREYADLLAHLPAGGDAGPAGEIRWMIEELRVSYFAQSLGTARPVSVQRIERAMDDIAL